MALLIALVIWIPPVEVQVEDDSARAPIEADFPAIDYGRAPDCPWGAAR
jgi:hypothetical protein